jgi:hypothetical protein
MTAEHRRKTILGMAIYLACQKHDPEMTVEQMHRFASLMAECGLKFTQKALDQAEAECIRLGKIPPNNAPPVETCANS